MSELEAKWLNYTRRIERYLERGFSEQESDFVANILEIAFTMGKNEGISLTTKMFKEIRSETDGNRQGVEGGNNHE